MVTDWLTNGLTLVVVKSLSRLKNLYLTILLTDHIIKFTKFISMDNHLVVEFVYICTNLKLWS